MNASLTQDHPKLDADLISSCIVAMVADKPDVKVSQIIERMQSKLVILYLIEKPGKQNS